MSTEEFNRYLNDIEFNKEALIRLYCYFYPKIILHIKRKYPSVSAEDIAQEFFLNLLNLKNKKYINNPASWVYICCDNIIKRKYRNNLSVVELKEGDFSCSDVVIENLIKDEKIKEIFKIIDDKETQYIIYLCYWEGYNLREIAEILNSKNSTIKQRHTRAIKKIKTVLNKNKGKE